MELQFPSQWHCTFIDNGVVDTSSDCTVTATTTYYTSVDINMPTTTASSTVPYGDWLIVNMLIVFFLGIGTMTGIFNIFRK